MILSRRIEVAADHAAYAGHFPDFPVLPGAVLLDEAVRIIAAERGIDLCAWQIASAKFVGPVRPGDVLRIEIGAESSDIIRFNIFAAERKVVSGLLSGANSTAP
jgi:3-hydroxyacyl-[acyl-carrier-protein] dehydratase